jgi:hypothetical protein
MISAVLSFLLLATQTQAQGEGTGPNQVIACQKARKAALQQAVEQVAGVYIQSHTLVRQDQLLAQLVYAHADGFVSSVPRESARTQPVLGSKDVLCFVELTADIENVQVADHVRKLRAALAARGKPKLLLLIAGDPNRQVETALMQRLQQEGWEFVDSQVVATHDVTPTDQELFTLGQLNAAEVVVYGYLAHSVLPAAADTGVVLSTAQLALRSVATDSGEVDASLTLHATGAAFNALLASSRAFEKLADAAAQKLSQLIVDKWARQILGMQRLVLTLRNVKDFAAVKRFEKDMLHRLDGVIEIHMRQFAPEKTLLDVYSNDPPDRLAEFLAAERLGGYRAKIVRTSANMLEVSLIP